ncbi:hypothetical protein QYM36_018947 [Artemia franciscana]|uniref:Endonuclease-reverse transcriptase n=1 Tax=Artemia franciscana TaxID=6661 RepID=A0AA88HBS2_ARTSF|nr:hypothetical protein QYM36_018947 [Artemia franciscana]
MEERLLDKKVQEELKVLKEGKLPVDQMIDGLNGIIHEITPKVSPEGERKEFFYDECLARKKELIQIVEKVKTLKESPLKVTVVLQMKAIWRNYKQLLKQKKREAEIRDIKQLSESFKMNDMKVFWRKIQDPEKRKSTQQKCPEPETWPPYFEIGKDTAPLGVLNSIPTEGTCFPLQEHDYSLLEETKEEEIKNILKSQKGGTAPGLDGIPIMVYKKFALSFVPIMVLIFNAILSTCKCPEAWKTSVILPLFKKGNAEEHSNYR